MTLRTHWKKWPLTRKNVLIYSNDLVSVCLRVSHVSLSGLEVAGSIRCNQGPFYPWGCPSAPLRIRVWPFTVHLPVLVAAGLHVPVPALIQKLPRGQLIHGSFIHREVSHLGRCETRMAVFPGKRPVCCGTHNESRLGPTVEMEDLLAVGVTQRKT